MTRRCSKSRGSNNIRKKSVLPMCLVNKSLPALEHITPVFASEISSKLKKEKRTRGPFIVRLTNRVIPTRTKKACVFERGLKFKNDQNIW